MPVYSQYGNIVTYNNFGWNFCLFEKLTLSMRFKLFSKNKKRREAPKDQVLVLGRRQIEKLAQLGLGLPLMKV
jgi:hypothetical protein